MIVAFGHLMMTFRSAEAVHDVIAAFASVRAALSVADGHAPHPAQPGGDFGAPAISILCGVLYRPKRYHRRLRHVFFMAAFSAAQREGPSREFYQRKRAEHQRHVQATIPLARRLVDVLWALLRDQREWQPTVPTTVAA